MARDCAEFTGSAHVVTQSQDVLRVTTCPVSSASSFSADNATTPCIDAQSVVIRNTQFNGKTWCLVTQTTSHIVWEPAHQSWRVSYDASATLNPGLAPDAQADVVRGEQAMLETMGIRVDNLLQRKKCTSRTTSTAVRPEDVVVCYGWYKLVHVGRLSCEYSGRLAFKIDSCEKDIFMRIVAGDCKDMIFIHTLQSSHVKRLDFWRKAFCNPLITFDRNLLPRVACVASQLPTFVDFLRYLQTTRIVHTMKVESVLRCAWAIYRIQRHVRS